jgi:mannose-6-phosphate isomerase
MMSTPSYPLRFRPILRRLVWGGRRLGTVLHKPLGDDSDYAESWELADYHDQVSVVADGSLTGSTIRHLVQTRGAELLGPALARSDQFPLLVKYIDANQPLSVQVHPNDELGRRLANDNGKTEAWVIVAADPGSLIYAGLNRGVDRDALENAIRSGTVEPLLNHFEPKPGDCIMIEAGTVHAIGAGVLLAEIQQMSDATFRIYDWGRVGLDGKPRALHVDQALASIDFERGPVVPLRPVPVAIDGGGTCEELARCAYFALSRLTLEASATAPVGLPDRFTIVMGLGGSAEIRHERSDGHVLLELGQTLLLPAALGQCSIAPRGRAVVLTCVVP